MQLLPHLVHIITQGTYDILMRIHQQDYFLLTSILHTKPVQVNLENGGFQPSCYVIPTI